MSAQEFGTNQAIDDSSWFKSLAFRIGWALESLVNEFVVCAQFVFQPTSATASYEKSGTLVLAEQRDSSDYASSITKDAVTHDARMRIVGGTKTGRGWVLYAEIGCDADSDGLLVGFELGGFNNGSSQPELDQVNSKILQSWVASEGNSKGHMTAVAVIEGGPAKFYKGIVGNRNAFVDDSAPVFVVRDNDGICKWGVFSDGHVQASSVGYDLLETSDGKPPVMNAGDEIMWGDGSTGTTYKVFFDGANYFCYAPSKVIPK